MVSRCFKSTAAHLQCECPPAQTDLCCAPTTLLFCLSSHLCPTFHHWNLSCGTPGSSPGPGTTKDPGDRDRIALNRVHLQLTLRWATLTASLLLFLERLSSSIINASVKKNQTSSKQRAHKKKMLTKIRVRTYVTLMKLIPRYLC